MQQGKGKRCMRKPYIETQWKKKGERKYSVSLVNPPGVYYILDIIRDIIDTQCPVQIFVDDDMYDTLDSLLFPQGRDEEKYRLFFECLRYCHCIIRPEPTLGEVEEITGLAVIVGVRVDGSVYVEGIRLRG